jgi:hypothetical protein
MASVTAACAHREGPVGRTEPVHGTQRARPRLDDPYTPAR